MTTDASRSNPHKDDANPAAASTDAAPPQEGRSEKLDAIRRAIRDGSYDVDTPLDPTVRRLRETLTDPADTTHPNDHIA